MNNKKTLFGLLDYQGKYTHFNIGDYIQSIAARQFLPKVDVLIKREKLNQYSNIDTKMIMNGWFLHNPQNWPPSNSITPLFISFHLYKKIEKEFFTNDNIEYLRKHEPIGCRDYSTVELFQKYSIRSYFSSCLTTTLGKSYLRDEPGDKIYFVDCLYNLPELKDLRRSPKSVLKKLLNSQKFRFFNKKKILSQIFDEDILQKKEEINHMFSNKIPEEERFNIAHNLLKKYASAKLIVTSRIHAALPALAMGTPVIFLKSNFTTKSDHLARFDGVLQFMNVIEVDSSKITSNFKNPGRIKSTNIPTNKNDFKKYTVDLEKKCEEFINN